MDINGWLTVITVIAAFFALMPKEELTIYSIKTSVFEKGLMFFLLVFLLPFLILFKDISSRIVFLQNFTIENGIKPQNLAFVFFFITFIWILFRLFISKPRKGIRTLIQYYLKILVQKPFEEFFSLYSKHTTIYDVKKNWNKFRVLYSRPDFIKGVLKNHCYHLLPFWENYDNETDFQLIFRLLLDDFDSVYYIELKEEPNVYGLALTPFIKSIAKIELNRSIQFGLFGMVEDKIRNTLQGESSKSSVYNQEHFYPAESKIGHHLPVLFHIRFIGIVYDRTIKTDYAITGIRQTLFSTVIKIIVKNIQPDGIDLNREYPLQYHWLIKEICSIHQHWIEEQGKKVFSPSSNLNAFVNYSFWLCLQELFNAKKIGKVSQEFVNSVAYYNFFSVYFNHETVPKFLSVMEEEVIGNIPITELVPILDKVMDEEFAMKCWSFCEGQGRFKERNPNLNRLFCYLLKQNKIKQLISEMQL